MWRQRREPFAGVLGAPPKDLEPPLLLGEGRQHHRPPGETSVSSPDGAYFHHF